MSNVYDHEAVIHGFVRKALRYAGDEADLDEREQLEEDLPEYAASIDHFGGYNLDAQLAALAAERDALRELERLAIDVADYIRDTSWSMGPIRKLVEYIDSQTNKQPDTGDTNNDRPN